jgi:ABC-type antimicrobial peptide transport system permease subunit
MSATASAIPEQVRVSWATALGVSWAGIRRRLLRSLITMSGVVLAIALLSYMLTMNSVTGALTRAADPDNRLFQLLQEQGVDVMGASGPDRMMVLLLGLALLTSTVGILNAMLMSVTERIREIGTLKCLGATDQFIVRSYFIESSIQGVLGAALGAAMGLVVALAVAGRTYPGYVLQHLPALLLLRALLLSVAAGAAMSVLAAIAPAYSASRKQPVEALRVEE